MYKEYIKDKVPGTPLYVNRKQYGDIIRRANEAISDYVLKDTYHLRLPFALGILYIVKKRINYAASNLPIDWENSKKYGKRIYHTNEHTNEYRYRWMWNLKRASVKHGACYFFIPCRTNSRNLAKILKTGKDYPNEN